MRYKIIFLPVFSRYAFALRLLFFNALPPTLRQKPHLDSLFTESEDVFQPFLQI